MTRVSEMMALERWMPGHLCLSVCLSVLPFCPSPSLAPATLPPSGLPCWPLFLSGAGWLWGGREDVGEESTQRRAAMFLLLGFFSPSWVCTLPGLLRGPLLPSRPQPLGPCSLPGLSWVPGVQGCTQETSLPPDQGVTVSSASCPPCGL